MNFRIRNESVFPRSSKPKRDASRGCLTNVRLHASAFACAIALFASQATAVTQVIDSPAWMQEFLNFAKTVKEYEAQAKRWIGTAAHYQQQISHYQQQLIKLQRLQMLRSQMPDNFPEREVDYGMEDLCPGPKGGIDGAALKLMSQFNPQMDSNLVDEQHRLCQRMVMAENAKYNESARMLKTLIKRNQEFESVESQRDQVGDSEGKLAANENEAQRFMIRTRMDLDYWQARMKAYDDYILALKQDQTRLARRALEGKREGGLIKVIQNQALKSAITL